MSGASHVTVNVVSVMVVTCGFTGARGGSFSSVTLMVRFTSAALPFTVHFTFPV